MIRTGFPADLLRDAFAQQRNHRRWRRESPLRSHRLPAEPTAAQVASFSSRFRLARGTAPRPAGWCQNEDATGVAGRSDTAAAGVGRTDYELINLGESPDRPLAAKVRTKFSHLLGGSVTEGAIALVLHATFPLRPAQLGLDLLRGGLVSPELCSSATCLCWRPWNRRTPIRHASPRSPSELSPALLSPAGWPRSRGSGFRSWLEQRLANCWWRPHRSFATPPTTSTATIEGGIEVLERLRW